MCAGCTTLDYYSQAVGGQLELWRKQASIAELLAGRELSPDLRAKLELVLRARAFAARQLMLDAHGSYARYVELGREFVVWNVFATPALSLEPYAWCYPLLGCLSYRGYFSATAAAAAADTLRARGFDTFVGGVAAYSTLGWFDDPVTSAMLREDDTRIVEVIFHELAHARFYVAGDTAFNEGFAMAVARAGIELWLADDVAAQTRYLANDAREQSFLALLREFHGALDGVFRAPGSAPDKRAEKARLYRELQTRYRALTAAWPVPSPYDEWMAHDLNNAKLAALATYHRDVPAFLSILEACNRDFSRFYAAVTVLARQSDRAQALAAAARARSCIGARRGRS